MRVNPLPLMPSACALAGVLRVTWCAWAPTVLTSSALAFSPERQFCKALRWLEENQLEDGRECLLRRAVISSDGRSREPINGTAAAFLSSELGQLLIQIHGQHAHQQLVKPEQQNRCSMAMQVSMHLLS